MRKNYAEKLDPEDFEDKGSGLNSVDPRKRKTIDSDSASPEDVISGFYADKPKTPEEILIEQEESKSLDENEESIGIQPELTDEEVDPLEEREEDEVYKKYIQGLVKETGMDKEPEEEKLPISELPKKVSIRVPDNAEILTRPSHGYR